MEASIFLVCFLHWCIWCSMDSLSCLLWYLDFLFFTSKEIISFILHGLGPLLVGFFVYLTQSLKLLYGLVLYTTPLVLHLVQGGIDLLLFGHNYLFDVYLYFLPSDQQPLNVTGFSAICSYSSQYTKWHWVCSGWWLLLHVIWSLPIHLGQLDC